MTYKGNVISGQIDVGIAQRHAQVVGERQRIEPLAVKEITDEARQLLMDMSQGFGEGIGAARDAAISGKESIDSKLKPPAAEIIPDSVATMMRHTDLFRGQMELSKALLGRGNIEKRERELVILRVAWLCRAPIEWGEHVEIAKLSGVTPDEIERVTKGSSAKGWSGHEHALLCAVEELLGDQSISDDTWDALAATWNERQLLELPVLVGVYHTFAMQHNSVRAFLPKHNKGLYQR